MPETSITIKELLLQARQRLSNSDSAQLDCEILLLRVLNENSERQYDKTWLLTWPDTPLTIEQQQQFEHYLQLRAEAMPVAYITGEKDFWTLTLSVNSATLIPRPETELLVEQVLELLPADAQASILELGTGTGAIALAIASERPDCKILATDYSVAAIQTARQNGQQVNLNNVEFFLSNWFTDIPAQSFDIIVSNPPYIAEDDPELEANVKQYEPLSALHAGVDGLDAIRTIIYHSHPFLKAGGWLLFEHGYTQATAIQSLLSEHGFVHICTINDLNNLPRVTRAQLP